MQQNAEIEARYQYVEARRREVDTESNWSTNAVVGRPGWNWEYVQPWDEAVEHDRWSGLEYRADHFTWTHKCDDRIICRWSFVSQHEIQSAESAAHEVSASFQPSTARGGQSASGISPHRVTSGIASAHIVKSSRTGKLTAIKSASTFTL